jgi:VanZ family protein
MNRTATTARRALLPLAMMGLIFFLSAQPDLDSGLGVIDLIGRKIVHLATYLVLTLAWFWALRPVAPPGTSLAIAAAIAFAYAVSDEYHQSFVEGRAGSPVDVAIDAIGVILAMALVRYDGRVRSVLDGEEP